jgi:hypothetical protein
MGMRVRRDAIEPNHVRRIAAAELELDSGKRLPLEQPAVAQRDHKAAPSEAERDCVHRRPSSAGPLLVILAWAAGALNTSIAASAAVRYEKRFITGSSSSETPEKEHARRRMLQPCRESGRLVAIVVGAISTVSGDSGALRASGYLVRAAGQAPGLVP